MSIIPIIPAQENKADNRCRLLALRPIYKGLGKGAEVSDKTEIELPCKSFLCQHRISIATVSCHISVHTTG